MKSTDPKLAALAFAAACTLLAPGAVLALADEEAPSNAPAADAESTPSVAVAPAAPASEPAVLLGGSCPRPDGLKGQEGQEPQEMLPCVDCDSQQNYCTSSGQCHTYCQNLVGEIGFCMPACGCCVCPEAPPPPPPPAGDPDICQPVCRCNGNLEVHPFGCPSNCDDIGNCN